MDILQDYASQLYAAYQNNDTSQLPLPLRYALSYLRASLSTPLFLLQRLFPLASPILAPLLTQLQSLLQTSPAIVSIGILIIILYAFIRVTSFLNRVVAYGVGILLRLAFWGLIGLAVAVVVQRGVGRTAEDVSRWVGVWWEEYQRWDAQQQRTRGSGKGSGRSYSSGNRAGQGRRNWS